DRVDPISGPGFDILGGADMDHYMPDHGGRAELAPYPDWVAKYVVHENPAEKDYMLINGDLAGSWPVHVREPSDGSMINIDQRPNYWLDPRAQPGNKPAGTPIPDPPYVNFGPTDPVNMSPLVPDNAHAPSLAYVPYLVTGDRYYLDEMKFWADY